jgi:predicted PurR-regulated permease PerM
MEEPKKTESGRVLPLNGYHSTAVMIEAISIRSMPSVVLTVIATLYFINWAQAVLLPLVVALLVSCTLDPIVSTSNAFRMPRSRRRALNKTRGIILV